MGEVRDCPECGLVNPPSAQRCDCGYDFAARRVLDSYLTEKDVARAAADAQAQRDQYLPWKVLMDLVQRFAGS